MHGPSSHLFCFVGVSPKLWAAGTDLQLSESSKILHWVASSLHHPNRFTHWNLRFCIARHPQLSMLLLVASREQSAFFITNLDLCEARHPSLENRLVQPVRSDRLSMPLITYIACPPTNKEHARCISSVPSDRTQKNMRFLSHTISDKTKQNMIGPSISV